MQLPQISLTVLVSAATWLTLQPTTRPLAVPNRPRAVQVDTSFATAPWVWRNIGPARISGNVQDIAVALPTKPGDPRPGAIMYVAAPGGLFKTADGGMHWKPLLDDKVSAAAQTIAIAPSDQNVIYVGTGDWQVYFDPHAGRGLLKSIDAGEHWTTVGFERSEYIGAVRVHPTDPNTVYVGVIGPLATASKDRGIYKSTDGGKTWTQIHYVNEWTGVVDLAIDPKDPNTIYASTMQQGISPRAYIEFGPGSGLWKSTDAGKTWKRLTNGLPNLWLGRCGIAVSPVSSNILYAVLDIVGETRSKPLPDNEKRIVLYRSLDGGEHWDKAGSAWNMLYGAYSGRVFADPQLAGRAYVITSGLAVTSDTGRTVSVIPLVPAADAHALWIDPTNSQHIMMGNDHGVFISENAAKTWRHIENLTLARFWSLGVDTREFFYRVYGSPQDSYGFGGPSRSRNYFGITNEEWVKPPSAENGPIAVDPKDTSMVYATGSDEFGGGVFRFDITTHKPFSIGPFINELGQSQEPREFRRGSLIISAHDHKTVYFPTTRVWKSLDHGITWRPISPTFDQPQPDSDVVMGRRVREAMRRYTTWNLQSAIIEKMDESPVDARVLWAGTRNGTLMVTRDGGKTWQRTADRPGPKGLPVTAIVASHFAPGTAYTATRASDVGNHKAYIYKTTDYGANWTPIANNIPDGADVWSLAEHFRTKGLLFAGTDDGVYASIDDGATWAKMRGSIPHTGRARDLVIQKAANDLVVAVWGRGAYVLDDITPLENWATAAQSSKPYLFPIRRTMRFMERGWTQYEEPQYGAPNPPWGVLISYYAAPGTSRGDTIDITNTKGQLVRSYATDTAAGFHRFAWDMAWSQLGEKLPAGARARPGRYTARFRHGAPGSERTFEIIQDDLTPVSNAVWDSIDTDAQYVWKAHTGVEQVAATGRTLIVELDTVIARIKKRMPVDEMLLARVQRTRDSAEKILHPIERPLPDFLGVADDEPAGASAPFLSIRGLLDGGRYYPAHPAPLFPAQRRLIQQASAVGERQRALLKAFLTSSTTELQTALRSTGLTAAMQSADTSAKAKADSLIDAAKLLRQLTEPFKPFVSKVTPYTRPIEDDGSIYSPFGRREREETEDYQ